MEKEFLEAMPGVFDKKKRELRENEKKHQKKINIYLVRFWESGKWEKLYLEELTTPCEVRKALNAYLVTTTMIGLINH